MKILAETRIAQIAVAYERGPPAPELARYDRLARQAKTPGPAAEERDPLDVLVGVLDRDGQQLSATQTWQQTPADAGGCPDLPGMADGGMHIWLFCA